MQLATVCELHVRFNASLSNLLSSFLHVCPWVSHTVQQQLASCYSNWPRFMLTPRVARWASLLSLGVRFGEATNPGPAWSLSVRNVVSAHKHSSELNDSSCCKVWTETSATSSTQRQIRNLAKQSKAYCSFSAPTSFRVHNDLVQVGRGEASGVLCYTPGQKQSTLQGSWDPVVWASGRVCDCIIALGTLQILIMGVYGFHS